MYEVWVHAAEIFRDPACQCRGPRELCRLHEKTRNRSYNQVESLGVEKLCIAYPAADLRIGARTLERA